MQARPDTAGVDDRPARPAQSALPNSSATRTHHRQNERPTRTAKWGVHLSPAVPAIPAPIQTNGVNSLHKHPSPPCTNSRVDGTHCCAPPPDEPAGDGRIEENLRPE